MTNVKMMITLTNVNMMIALCTNNRCTTSRSVSIDLLSSTILNVCDSFKLNGGHDRDGCLDQIHDKDRFHLPSEEEGAEVTRLRNMFNDLTVLLQNVVTDNAELGDRLRKMSALQESAEKDNAFLTGQLSQMSNVQESLRSENAQLASEKSSCEAHLARLRSDVRIHTFLIILQTFLFDDSCHSSFIIITV